MGQSDLPFPRWLLQDLVLHHLVLVADVLEIWNSKLLNRTYIMK